MKRRPDTPITAEEVMGWFAAAKVPGARPKTGRPAPRLGLFAGAKLNDELLAAAQKFAVLVERRRGPKDAYAHAIARANARAIARPLSEWIDASHAYLRVLLALPAYLKRLPEVRALAAALRPVVAFPASKRGRPTDGGTLAAVEFMTALEASLPKRASKRARGEIVVSALRACGYGVEKTVENIARADRRRRAKAEKRT